MIWEYSSAVAIKLVSAWYVWLRINPDRCDCEICQNGLQSHRVPSKQIQFECRNTLELDYELKSDLWSFFNCNLNLRSLWIGSAVWFLLHSKVTSMLFVVTSLFSCWLLTLLFQTGLKAAGSVLGCPDLPGISRPSHDHPYYLPAFVGTDRK